MEQTATVPAVTGHTKQYVFVDEYNRHKRLKVMRACDGCRKRKIRCDGALQNGPWPCGACQRLKLKCVPPTLDQEEEQLPQQQPQPQSQQHQHSENLVNSNQNLFDSSVLASRKNSLGFPQQQQMLHDWASAVISPVASTVQSTTPIRRVSHHNIYPPQFANGSHLLRRNSSFIKDEGSVASTEHGQVQHFRPVPNLLRSQTEQSADSRSSSGDPDEVDATVKELSEAMGDLNIDHTAIAPYIANQKKSLAEAPAIEESEIVLPPSVGTDTTVRIPSEMMPNKERVMDYFGYFFAHIHPYVPVLNRRAFYEQWTAAPSSVSPLILEAIFACTTRYLDEPIEVRKWLALAARHEESFKDVPRLSTIQAMILLTKAREFAPKRGYYYRSWMAIKYMTTMAFDLGLHEHHDQHRIGEDCKFSRADCMMRTRIWQTLLGLEILVGHPQGRTDYAVQLDAVEFDIPSPLTDVDAFEYSTTRRHTYFAQVYRNIKQTSILWLMMKKYKKDWALDPSFIRHNEDLTSWLRDLPGDLQIQYLDDGSPPFLGGDHYIAYLHTYHQLVVIMHHRPQLQALLERKDPAFKTELEICANAAALMCRLQEALLRDFGLHGLQFMQRGINFTIYCVLTCTMLHCAAITSPDPVMNSSARSYFTRHMRILEHCIPSAPPEMQAQIQNLREAFSQNTNKPFELKPSLGMRSPSAESDHATPPSTHSTLNATAPIQCTTSWPHVQDDMSSKNISPTSEFGQSLDSAASHSSLSYSSAAYGVSPSTSYASHNLQRVTSSTGTTYTAEPILTNGQQPSPSLWDPSGILDQWNTAFGSQPAPPAAQALRSSGHQNLPPVPQFPQQHSPTTTRSMYMPPQIPSSSSPVEQENAPTMQVVTPVMWQDAFSTAFVSGHGHKRHREDGMGSNSYSHYQKRRA